jgi:hypothetical protein
MYPVERRMYTLKRYLRNRARPEGSIAEGYIADECLTFCSRYMVDVETVYNKEPRNSAFEDHDAYDVEVFGHGVKFVSACDYDVEDPEEVKKWCGMFCTTVMKWSNIDGMFSHIS